MTEVDELNVQPSEHASEGEISRITETIVVESMKLTLPSEPVLINGEAFRIVGDHQALAEMYRTSRDRITDSNWMNNNNKNPKLNVKVGFEDNTLRLKTLHNQQAPKKPVELNRKNGTLEITLPRVVEDHDAEIEILYDYQETINMLFQQGMVEYIRFGSMHNRFFNGFKSLMRLGVTAGAVLGGAAAEHGNKVDVLVDGTAGAAIGGLAVLAAGAGPTLASMGSKSWSNWRQNRAATYAEKNGNQAYWRILTDYVDVFSLQPIEAIGDISEPTEAAETLA